MLLVPDYLIDVVCLDKSRDGIFDAENIALDSCLNLAVFKREIGVLHRAILKNKSTAIAKRLCALDVTTDKAQIFGIPTEIFTLKHGIVNCYVLGVPEGVLGFEI